MATTRAGEVAARCLLCQGVCPDCGSAVGKPAGSAGWILCSACHATFRHGTPAHLASSDAGDDDRP